MVHRTGYNLECYFTNIPRSFVRIFRGYRQRNTSNILRVAPVIFLINFLCQRVSAEREADMFASFYLTHRDIGGQPLENTFKKLKFSTDAINPFGGGGGLFGTHRLGQPLSVCLGKC